MTYEAYVVNGTPHDLKLTVPLEKLNLGGAMFEKWMRPIFFLTAS